MHLSRRTIISFLIISFLFILFPSIDLSANESNNSSADNISIRKNNINNAPEDTGKKQEALLAQARAGDKPADVKEQDDPDKEKVKKKKGLKPLVIKGSRDRKKTNIQTISRQTMTVEDIKMTPASFGDSMHALTSLPGISTAWGGFFGPLVIRGANYFFNTYLIDDIPVDNPMHFGGLHSVINTNLISDVDVYSSAFPAEFGSATAAVININTIDNVSEFSGYTDLSLLSASALIKAPILKDKFGHIFMGKPSKSEYDDEMENAGYMIASGRYGYISLGIKAAELITGEDSPVNPEYWDYQFKGKYKFNDVHSLSLLLFGHKDFLRAETDEDMLEEGDDPLWGDMEFKMNTMSHNHGLYLDSEFTSDFSNRLLYYGALPETHQYMNSGSPLAASWFKDINQYFRPWIFGLKDKVRVKWLDGHSELRGDVEYNYYHFKVNGDFFKIKETSGEFNPADEDAFTKYPLNETIKNHKFGGYIENRITYGGFTLLPGIRSEYLERTAQHTLDPRLMTSYKFSSDTTISAAGGHYSNFIQTNPNYFSFDPGLAAIGNTKIKPEKAWHSALGLEQEFGIYSIKIEGFNNYFYDLAYGYEHTEADGTELSGLSSGKMKAYGFEILLRKDLKENQNGLFGWLSYTYTRSKEKSGLPTGLYYDGVLQTHIGDEWGDKWTTSYYEQLHCLKLVAGYRFWAHMLSGKFQYYSGYPYTPITGLDTDFSQPDSLGRYTPKYGYRNSKHFPVFYQLDLRYTHTTKHSWGYISWYVEVINIFSSKEYEYKWYWDRGYAEGSNPRIREDKEALAFLPNFGVEVKF